MKKAVLPSMSRPLKRNFAGQHHSSLLKRVSLIQQARKGYAHICSGEVRRHENVARKQESKLRGYTALLVEAKLF